MDKMIEHARRRTNMGRLDERWVGDKALVHASDRALLLPHISGWDSPKVRNGLGAAQNPQFRS